MKNLEIHVIESVKDEHDAVASGLLEENEPNIECLHCRASLGYDPADSTFVEYRVVIDDNDEPWLECTNCVDSNTTV